MLLQFLQFSLHPFLFCIKFKLFCLCYNASTIQVGAVGLAQQSTEHDTLNTAFPSATSASDLHSVDTDDVVKVIA